MPTKGDIVLAQSNNTNATPATALAAVVAANIVLQNASLYPKKVIFGPLQMVFNVTADNFTAWQDIQYIQA